MKKISLRRAKAAVQSTDEDQAPDIKLKFNYSYTDYMEANQAHWAGRRQVYTCWCAILFVLSLVYIYCRPHQGRGYIAGVLSLIFLLILTRYFQHYLDFAWKWNKTYRQTFDAEVTGKNLQITGATVDTKIDWALVDKFAETANLFLLYQRSRSFVMVPKRAFLADAAVGVRGLNQFRTFVARKAEAGAMRRAPA